MLRATRVIDGLAAAVLSVAPLPAPIAFRFPSARPFRPYPRHRLHSHFPHLCAVFFHLCSGVFWPNRSFFRWILLLSAKVWGHLLTRSRWCENDKSESPIQPTAFCYFIERRPSL